MVAAASNSWKIINFPNEKGKPHRVRSVLAF
jgi:hypothetical protein